MTRCRPSWIKASHFYRCTDIDRSLYARNKSVTRGGSRNVTPISRAEQSNEQVISSSKRERKRETVRGWKGVARVFFHYKGVAFFGWRREMRSKNLSPRVVAPKRQKNSRKRGPLPKISIVIALLLNRCFSNTERKEFRSSRRYLSPFTIQPSSRFDQWKPN